MIAANKFGVQSREKNDCSVRAIANAASISYDEAYEILAECGRKKNEGVFEPTLIRAMLKVGYWSLKSFGNNDQATDVEKAWPFSYEKFKGISLKNAMMFMQEGYYIVNISGHVFAVIDGEIVDNVDYREGTHVYSIFKFEY